MILLFAPDVSPLTFANKLSDVKAQIWQQFTISINYTVTAGTSEAVYTVELFRQRYGENENLTRIVVFFVTPAGNVSLDSSLLDRTIPTQPTSPYSSKGALQFLNIVCSDKATYQWAVNYLHGSTLKYTTDILNFSLPVKVPTAFSATKVLTYAPNKTSIAENTEVTFTCSGDVGSEPTGVLGWYYYLNNLSTVVFNVSGSASPGNPVASDCSFYRTSVLKLNLTKEHNSIVVRCTIQQDKQDQFGDGYIQTSNIEVQYRPRINPISKSESGPYVEGRASLSLTCTADALPDPKFYWVLPDVNGTVVPGGVYTLTNLTLNDTGVYTCTAYNTINGQNYSVNTTTTITVDRKTTTPPPTTTTTTTSTSTVAGTSVTKPPNASALTDDSKSKTNNIIIGVVVGVGGAIIIIIIITVVLLKKRKENPKIEEPPEKPRNNRPDLVIADNKNFGPGYALNSSFNNSFDSSSDYKLRNEDAINGYDNLQFDDKPRSRKPIQLLENSGSNSMFSNVTMPKV